MKGFIAILLLGASARALVLCPQNACDTIKCDVTVTSESCAANGGVLRANGGYCQCCDICVKTLNEGDDCTQTLLLGAPATAECDSNANLHCDPQLRQCAKKSCAMIKGELEVLPVKPPGLSIPVCDSDGSYSGKQCTGSQCYCVDTKGREIPGYGHNLWETDDKVTCQCARDFAAYQKTGLIGRLFHCTPKGDYESVQCHGSVCYCADRSTGLQVEGVSGVHISNKASLVC